MVEVTFSNVVLILETGLWDTEADMAMTHEDVDHNGAKNFMRELEARADQLEGKAKVASDGPTLQRWQSNNVDVAKLSDDEQGILRISIGGGQTPVPLNYLRFRGDHGACVDLLRKALKALETQE